MAIDIDSIKSERRAHVQGDGAWWSKRARDKGVDSNGFFVKPPGTIEWWEHLMAFDVYSKRHGHQQSAERIAERGGFGYSELSGYLGHEPLTWKER